MVYLREIRLDKPDAGGYPFGVRAVAALGSRRFESDITFFAGENGMGKSTLLEALARKQNMPSLGTEDAGRDPTLLPVAPLSAALRMTWNRRPKRGFFLRAEDFFGFTRRVAASQAEMREELARVEEEYANRSLLAQEHARMPFAGTLGEMNSLYGDDPDGRSHGEGFLAAFGARMLPGGLYLLDEPESALSPTSQLALLSMLNDLRGSCQFLIATHSPILLAMPGAQIWLFGEEGLSVAAWEELPGVCLTRDFLARPERYFHQLFRGGGEDTP